MAVFRVLGFFLCSATGILVKERGWKKMKGKLKIWSRNNSACYARYVVNPSFLARIELIDQPPVVL
jgi:hypothetical protein